MVYISKATCALENWEGFLKTPYWGRGKERLWAHSEVNARNAENLQNKNVHLGKKKAPKYDFWAIKRSLRIEFYLLKTGRWEFLLMIKMWLLKGREEQENYTYKSKEGKLIKKYRILFGKLRKWTLKRIKGERKHKCWPYSTQERLRPSRIYYELTLAST